MLKIVLIFGMFIGHTLYLHGHTEFNYLYFWWVYPTFAALVGINAFSLSRDPVRYGKRLLAWALITQPIHIWFFGSSIGHYPNALFGLSAACFLVYYLQSKPLNFKPIKIPPWAFYAFYPAHFILIKLLYTFGTSAG